MKHSDAEKIERLGGTACLAKLLKINMSNVTNWKRRGIPYKMIVTRPDVFVDRLKYANEQTAAIANDPAIG